MNRFVISCVMARMRAIFFAVLSLALPSLVTLAKPSIVAAEEVSTGTALIAAERRPPPVAPSDPPRSRPSFDLTVAFAGGAMHLGPYEFGGAGVRGGLGFDLGRFDLAIDQTLLYVASPSVGVEASGIFSRTGLTARIPIGTWAYQDGAVSGQLELGGGWQRLPSDPSTSRWDVAAGWMLEVQVPKVAVVLGGRFLAAPERKADDFLAVAGTRKRNHLDMGVLVTLGARFATTREHNLAKRRSISEQGERGDTAGFEYGLGMRNIGGTRYFAGTVAVRRSRDFGKTSLGAEGSVTLLSHRDRELSLVRDDGLMARLGATVKYSLWQPSGRSLRGDFFVDGGAGYAVGSVTSGRFHDVDIQAGGGAGYELLPSDPQSPARSLSAYVALRAIAPAHDVSRLGLSFSVGLGWRR